MAYSKIKATKKITIIFLKAYKRKDNTSYLLFVSFKNAFLLEYIRFAAKLLIKSSILKAFLFSLQRKTCYFYVVKTKKEKTAVLKSSWFFKAYSNLLITF